MIRIFINFLRIDFYELHSSLFNFINNSTSSFHTVLNAQSYLIKNGFEEVDFSEDWQLKADKKYFTKIYDSTLIAFIPHQNLREGMKIAVSHTDFPCLKIKPSADIMQMIMAN